jgi:hypothetical protein
VLTAGLIEGIKMKKENTYREWYDQSKKFVKDHLRLEQDPQIDPAQGPLLQKIVFTPAAFSQTQAGTRTPAKRPKVPDIPISSKTLSPAASTRRTEGSKPAALPPSSSPIPMKPLKTQLLILLEPGAEASPTLVEELNRKLKQISFVRTVQGEPFDRLIRIGVVSGGYEVRVITPAGDSQRFRPFVDSEEIMKNIIPQLEFAHLIKRLAGVTREDLPFKVKVWMKDKVETIPPNNLSWSEDTLVIRSHK